MKNAVLQKKKKLFHIHVHNTCASSSCFVQEATHQYRCVAGNFDQISLDFFCSKPCQYKAKSPLNPYQETSKNKIDPMAPNEPQKSSSMSTFALRVLGVGFFI